MTPEQHPQADEAAQYVLGQLSPAARHAFEVQLAQSAELRALVQELEEGVEALARAVPQRPPPPQTWSPIEEAISQEMRRKVVMLPAWSNWWRSGWAAAAACLLVFLGYAWWPSHKENPPMATSSTPVEIAVENPVAEVKPTLAGAVRPEVRRPTNVMVSTVPKTNREGGSLELASLRSQIVLLQSQLEQLSEVVSQQKAIMSEPGRFKFFPLASTSAAGTENPSPTTLSPELQRAISYAMAQDLGWLPRTAQSGALNHNPAVAPVTTVWGIDFVNLNNSQNLAATANAATSAQTTEAAAQTSTASLSVRSSGTIPGYLRNDSGNGLVLAFDPSIVSSGSTLSFWNTSGENYQFIGGALTGENPMVVTVPTERLNGDLTITASSAFGASNVLGNFFIIRYPPPPPPGTSFPPP